MPDVPPTNERSHPTAPSNDESGSFDDRPTEPVQQIADPPQPQPPRPARPRRPSDLGDDEILDAMQACDFEPAAAARLLGIRRPSLYKCIKRHPTLRLASDIPPQELAEVLEQVGGSVADAAQVLSVSKRALGRRLTELDMHPDGGDAGQER